MMIKTIIQQGILKVLKKIKMKHQGLNLIKTEENKEKPQKTLTEQQIQYLVDTAEKQEKTTKMKDKLLESGGKY